MAYLRSLHVCVVYTTQDLGQIQRTQGGKEFNQRTVCRTLRTNSSTVPARSRLRNITGLMPRIVKTEKSYSSSSNGTTVTSRGGKSGPLYSQRFLPLEKGGCSYFYGDVKRYFKRISGKKNYHRKSAVWIVRRCTKLPSKNTP